MATQHALESLRQQVAITDELRPALAAVTAERDHQTLVGLAAATEELARQQAANRTALESLQAQTRPRTS